MQQHQVVRVWSIRVPSFTELGSASIEFCRPSLEIDHSSTNPEGGRVGFLPGRFLSQSEFTSERLLNKKPSLNIRSDLNELGWGIGSIAGKQ